MDLSEERQDEKVFSVFLLCLAIFTISFHPPVLAANTQKGAKVFSTNCAYCHAGDQNLVKANKSLKK
jgi:cytochrome c6